MALYRRPRLRRRRRLSLYHGQAQGNHSAAQRQKHKPRRNGGADSGAVAGNSRSRGFDAREYFAGDSAREAGIRGGIRRRRSRGSRHPRHRHTALQPLDRHLPAHNKNRPYNRRTAAHEGRQAQEAPPVRLPRRHIAPQARNPPARARLANLCGAQRRALRANFAASLPRRAHGNGPRARLARENIYTVLRQGKLRRGGLRARL